MATLFSELKRRNVFRVAALYAVASWLILQIAELLFEALQVPVWTLRFVLAVLILGMPLVLIFSWIYEITPEGVKREKDVNRSESISRETGRKLDVAVIVMLLVTIGVIMVDRFVLEREAPAVVAAEEAAAKATAQTDAERPSEPDSSHSGVSPEEESVAVLPFVNMSPDPDNVYFSDGVSEEILNSLAAIDALRVAARTSSFQFRDREMDVSEIGRALNVANILEGSVRKAGNRVRITAQLIDADKGHHLWSETFDRELTDIFAIQDEIAQAVSEALQVTLLGDARPQLAATPQTVAAYDFYLLGKHQLNQRTEQSIEKAMGLFQQAIAQAPGLALAHVGLANAAMLLQRTPSTYGNWTFENVNAVAEPALDRALALDPDLAEAIASRGLLAQQRGRLDDALAEMTRALAINDNLAIAYVWRAVTHSNRGDFQAATSDIRDAYRIDPLSPLVISDLAWMTYFAGDGDFARQKIEEALELSPDFLVALTVKGWILRMEGEIQEAEVWFRRAVEISSAFAFSRTGLGLTLLDLRRPAEAIQVLQPPNRAFGLLATGDRDKAYLEAANTSVASLHPAELPAVFLAFAAAGRYQDVTRLFERWTDGDEQRRDAALASGVGLAFTGAAPGLLVAYAYRESGNRPLFQAALDDTLIIVERARATGDTPGFRYVMARIAALRGDDREASAWLHRAVERGYHSWWMLERDPLLGSVRNRPEVRALINRIKPADVVRP